MSTPTPDELRKSRELRDQIQREETARRYGALEWATLARLTPPPRTWWLQDWLSPDPTLCSGPGGIGKSILWQTLGTALACGQEFIAATTKPLRVLMWACEDDKDELWRRQVAVCNQLQIPLKSLEGKFVCMPRRGLDNTLFSLSFGAPLITTAFELLREQVNDLDTDVLVLDNIAQIYGGHGADGHQVTMFVNAVAGLVRGRPFCPVLLGHVARTPGSEYSGSAAWENSCRMYRLSRETQEQLRREGPGGGCASPIPRCCCRIISSHGASIRRAGMSWPSA